ncbi:hypothetical protein M0657_012263 [Pyricularia oryzae]|nr:hypothetical protein M0657_012263 [Pyricularia oryzae]
MLMITAGTREAVTVHLVCQNAGVVISRHEDSVYIEYFELFPLNSAVMKPSGRLRRYFPGAAMVTPAPLKNVTTKYPFYKPI